MLFYPHSIDCPSFVTCYWLKYSTLCLITLVCNLESLSLELLGIFSYDRMRKASKISPPSNQPHFTKIILSILYQQKYEITLELIFCCVNLYCTDMFQSNNAKFVKTTNNFKFSTGIIFWAILFGNNIKGEVLALFSYNFDSKSHDYIMVTIWQMTGILKVWLS